MKVLLIVMLAELAVLAAVRVAHGRKHRKALK